MLGVGCPKGNARPALSNKKANTIQKELNEAPNFQKGKKIKGLPFSKESKRRAWPPKRKEHEACQKRKGIEGPAHQKDRKRKTSPSKRKASEGPAHQKEGNCPPLQKGRHAATNTKGKDGPALQKGRETKGTRPDHQHIASQVFVDFR